MIVRMTIVRNDDDTVRRTKTHVGTSITSEIHNVRSVDIDMDDDDDDDDDANDTTRHHQQQRITPIRIGTTHPHHCHRWISRSIQPDNVWHFPKCGNAS